MPKMPKTKWEIAPAGTHNAICIRFIDLGTQKQVFKGEESEARQCRLYFDLIDEKTKDGKNVVAFQKYTYSPSPKGNLMKALRSWLGVKDSDFDMDQVLGKPAMITIEHNGEYANITAITSPTKGAKFRKSTEEVYSLHLTEEDFDVNVFNELPEGLQGKIMDSPEYAEVSAPKGKKKTVPPTKKGK